MRAIDAGLGGVNNNEHLSREIAGFAIKNHAWNFDLIQQTGIFGSEKMKPGQPMLAVNDQESRFGIFQITDRLKLAKSTKLQHFLRKEKNTSWNGGLCFGRLIESDDLPNFPAA